MFDTLSLAPGGAFRADTGEFTAIDFETTGLHPGHVVEVAAVRVRADGTVLGEFSTLVNPGPGVDPGPGHVHRISRAELDAAPTLSQVLGDFFDLCQGSVLVAHNLPFEAKFLAEEFARLRFRVPDLPGVCTLATARQVLRLPNYRLATVAEAVGIGEFAAHTALADARVCAQLVSILVTAHGLAFTTEPTLPVLPRFAPAARLTPRREKVPSGAASWMADLVDRVPLAGTGSLADAYGEMLGNALADRYVSDAEAQELSASATAAGLTAEGVRRIHHEFVSAMRTLAESDGIVTAEEKRDLHQVAAALGVPEVLDGLQRIAGPAPRRVLVLGSGSDADELRAEILSAGLQLAKKLTSSVTHLVACPGVPAAEPRLSRARELGAVVVPVSSAREVLGLATIAWPQSDPVEIPVALPQSPAEQTQALPAYQWPAPVPPPAKPRPAPQLWAGRGLIAAGLLLMFITVLAMFGGTPLVAGIFFGALGVGALLGGWRLTERASA